jgi:hydrophobic/amphiphilic exporter-1 (mainly G- bacteria), HAE1 family
VARELGRELKEIDGVINVSSDVSDARDEVNIHVDPTAAAEFGLSAAQVGQQVNQYIVGATVSEVDLNNLTMDVVVRGQPADVDDIENLENLDIAGPLGVGKLGSISQISLEHGPVSISRFDLERSATISGEITAEDTQAVGAQVQAKIDALELPPGVEVRTGGIFQQISEGFQDVFTAILIGVILVYLVMVASLGSLRDPFIVILSLPLAIVGALVALAITDRSLSLSALMGFLLLVGIVVTNAIVLISFVEQLRQTGMGVYDALIEAGRTRVRPILMTAFTTIIALFPLSISSGNEGGIIGAELATVVIGGLISSTFLTLIVVPVIYTILHVNLPGVFDTASSAVARVLFARPTARGQMGGDD